MPDPLIPLQCSPPNQPPTDEKLSFPANPQAGFYPFGATGAPTLREIGLCPLPVANSNDAGVRCRKCPLALCALSFFKILPQSPKITHQLGPKRSARHSCENGRLPPVFYILLASNDRPDTVIRVYSGRWSVSPIWGLLKCRLKSGKVASFPSLHSSSFSMAMGKGCVQGYCNWTTILCLNKEKTTV